LLIYFVEFRIYTHSTLFSLLQSKNGDKKPTLTTRMLLPYYKLEAVHQFMDIFAKVVHSCFRHTTDNIATFAHSMACLQRTPQVDENFSGDLDVNEWIRLFTSLNESVPVLEARMIFMKIGERCAYLPYLMCCRCLTNGLLQI